MITNMSIGKSIKFSIGDGYESMEVSIGIDFSMEEGRDQSMSDKEIIDSYTEMAKSYLKDQRTVHQKIIAEKSVFYRGGKK